MIGRRKERLDAALKARDLKTKAMTDEVEKLLLAVVESIGQLLEIDEAIKAIQRIDWELPQADALQFVLERLETITPNDPIASELLMATIEKIRDRLSQLGKQD